LAGFVRINANTKERTSKKRGIEKTLVRRCRPRGDTNRPFALIYSRDDDDDERYMAVKGRKRNKLLKGAEDDLYRESAATPVSRLPIDPKRVVFQFLPRGVLLLRRKKT
jgi:hypothetical protein